MEALVLPQYFRHGNFPSFIRQVLFNLNSSLICTISTNSTKKTSSSPSKISTLKEETKTTFILFKEEKKSNNSSLPVYSLNEKIKTF